MHLSNYTNNEQKGVEQTRGVKTIKAGQQDKDTGNDTWHTLKSMCLDRLDEKKGKSEEGDLKEDKLKTVSLEAQKKLDTFLCEKSKEGKKGCGPCRRTFEPSDLTLPCLFHKSNIEMQECQVGFLVRYAVLSGVRSTEPKVREAAITNFRNMCRVDDNDGSSDIKRMMTMPVKEWQSQILQMLGSDHQCVAQLEMLTQLFFSAIQCVFKTSPSCQENIRAESKKYLLGTSLQEADTDLYQTLFGYAGIFGYLAWFAKFVLHAINNDPSLRPILVLAEMWKFNTNICPALVLIYKYGSSKYPWMETVIYNFTSLFSHLWTQSHVTRAVERRDWAGTATLAPSPINPGALGLKKTLLPRLQADTTMCHNCKKRLPRSCKKLFPVCFQSIHKEEFFPREVACLEREASEYNRDVWSEDLTQCPRTIRLVCSTICLLRQLEGVNPTIHQVLKVNPPKGVPPDPSDTWPAQLETMKYFALRRLMEFYFYGKEHDATRQRQRATKFADKSPSVLRATLPDSLEPPVPAEMLQYQENMLLHRPNDGDIKCKHQQVWNGTARFHPIEDLRKYSAKMDSDGLSTSCVDTDILFETCESIDLSLQDEAVRLIVNLKIKQLEAKTIHLFNTRLAKIPVDYLREKCHKLAVQIHNARDSKRIFDGEQCLLGIWDVDFDQREVEGMLICKSPKTLYAFRPHHSGEFWSMLCENLSAKEVYNQLNDTVSSLTDSLSTCTELASWTGQELAKSSVKALAIIRMEMMRARLVNRFSPAMGTIRFDAVQLGCNAVQEEPNVLVHHSNGLNRTTSKHLVGCPHSLSWQGTLCYWKNTKSGDDDRFNTTAWAFECREVNQGRAQVPPAFWKMLPKRLQVVALKETFPTVREHVDKLPTFVIELGSVPRSCVEDLQGSDLMTLAFVSEDRKPRYVILLTLVSEKVVCIIVEDQGEVNLLYEQARHHCFEEGLTEGHSQLFGEVGTRSRQSGKWTFQRKEELEHDIHNQSVGYLNKSLGSVLWTGELQICLLQGDSVLGMDKHKELYKVIQFSIKEAKRKSEDLDIGSVRNCAFNSKSSHQVLSTYAAIVTEHKIEKNRELVELFSNDVKKGNCSLVSFNVERKAIENHWGTLKKCFFFNVHVHDSHYIHKELEEGKTTLIGFFLHPQEMMKDLFESDTAELGKRLMVLRYDHRMGVVVAYVPKEKGKGQELWEKLTKDGKSFTNSHVKAFSKLKRPAKARPRNANTESVKEWWANLEVSSDESESGGCGECQKCGKLVELDEKKKNDSDEKLKKGVEALGGKMVVNRLKDGTKAHIIMVGSNEKKDEEEPEETLKKEVEAIGGKIFTQGGVTVLGNADAIKDTQDSYSEKDDSLKENNVDTKKTAAKEKPALLDGKHAFAKNLKKMFPEAGTGATNGARPKETKGASVVGKKEKKQEERKKVQSSEEKENGGDDQMVLTPKLLAALAGPNGDQEKIIRIMKANGISASSPEERPTPDEESPHQKLRRGVEALGGKMVSLGGMTVLGHSDAVQDIVSARGVTVLGQAGAVDDLTSTLRQGGDKNPFAGVTVLGQAGAVDDFMSTIRPGAEEDPKEENGDPRPGRSDDKKICWHCQTPDGRFSAMAGKLITLSKCRGCRKVSTPPPFQFDLSLTGILSFFHRHITAWTSAKKETGRGMKNTASSS